MSGTREVPLSGGAFALIDDDDMALVSQYKWHVNDGCKVCVLNNQKKYHERKKRNEYTKRG